MVFVTLGAALASWTVMVTAWQLLLYGAERFHIRPFPICRAILVQLPTPRGHSPVFAIFDLPVVCVAMYVSQRDCFGFNRLTRRMHFVASRIGR